MIQRFICFIKDIYVIYNKYKNCINNIIHLYFRKEYDSLTVEVLFNEMSNREDLCKYLYDKLSLIITDEYKINLFELPRCEMSCDDAAGVYVFRRGMSIEQQLRTTTDNLLKFKILNLPKKDILKLTIPRIEILEDKGTESKLFTLAHELGHHLIEMGGEEQTEVLADFKVLEVFQKHFDPIFIGIFKTMITIVTKLENEDVVPDFNKFYYDYYVNSPYVEKFNLKLLK